jgi:hypothetical protein
MEGTPPNYGWANSTSRSQTDDDLQSFCKNLLKAKLFVGHYQERRRVDSILAYRDLIVLPEAECDMIRYMKIVAKRIEDHHGQQHKWIGITDKQVVGAPAGFCVWTELEDVPFGKYWFEVKTVRFRDNEVLIRVKMIRPFVEAGESSTESSATNTTLDAGDFVELLIAKKNGFLSFWYDFIATGVTTENVIAALKFTCLLFVGLVHGSVEFVKFLGYFSIRFMHEFNRLIHVCTPLFLGILDFCSKIVGGLYILVAMFFRDSRKSEPPRQIHYDQAAVYQRRAIRYDDDYR